LAPLLDPLDLFRGRACGHQVAKHVVLVGVSSDVRMILLGERTEPIEQVGPPGELDMLRSGDVDCVEAGH
jgi:hypothetical protein